MKNIPRILILLFCISQDSFAQTFVSTEPTRKVVILEEYTGNRCQYCPEGHKVSDEIKAVNPKNYIAINIHAGSLAAAYQTDFGDVFLAEAKVPGFPAATIDRTIFSGESGMAIGNRSLWKTRVNSQMEIKTCVNVAAKTKVDYITRKMECTVEVYYTGNSSTSENFLQVALLQNNVIGGQTGLERYPEMMVGKSKYRHNHMLRHLLSGQWGDTIAQTQKGSFFTKTYTYTLPEKFYEEAFDIGNMELVVFVTESKAKILNAAESELLITNAPNNPKVMSVKQYPLNTCENQACVQVKVHNRAAVRMDKLEFVCDTDSKINDTVVWQADNKNGQKIAPGDSGLCILSPFEIILGEENQVDLRLIAVNGAAVNDSVASAELEGHALVVKNVHTPEELTSIRVEFATDQYGSEVRWRIYNVENSEVLIDTSYTVDIEEGGSTKYEHFVNIRNSACHIFEVFDAASDGINNGNGKGYYKIYDNNGKLLTESDGIYTDKDYRIFNFTTSNTKEEIQNLSNLIRVFPNPATTSTRVSFLSETTESVFIKLYDTNGKLVNIVFAGNLLAGTNNIDIPLLNIPAGIYFLQVQIGTNQCIKKISKQ